MNTPGSARLSPISLDPAEVLARPLGAPSVSSANLKVIHSGRRVHTLRRREEGSRSTITTAAGVVAVRPARLLSALKPRKGSAIASPFSTVAVAPDGTTAATGGKDGAIRYWDLATGEELLVLDGHRGSCVDVLRYSPTARRLASGGHDATVRVWDSTSGEALLTLAGAHTYAVTALAFSPDGRRIVAGARDSVVSVWDSVSGDLVNRLKGHSDWLLDVGFVGNDSSRVISGAADGTARVWDVTSGADVTEKLVAAAVEEAKRLAELARHPSQHSSPASLRGRPQSAAEPPGAGATSNTVVAGAPAGSSAAPGFKPLSGARALAISRDGTLAAAGTAEGILRIWRPARAETLMSVQAHAGAVASVTFSLDGSMVATGGYDASVTVWAVPLEAAQEPSGAFVPGSGGSDCDDGPLLVLRDLEKPVTAVRFATDNSMVAASAADGVVAVWDARSGEVQQKLAGFTGGVTAIDFTLDTTRLAAVGWDGTARAWEMPEFELVSSTALGTDATAWPPAGMQISDDERTVYVLSRPLAAPPPIIATDGGSAPPPTADAARPELFTIDTASGSGEATSLPSTITASSPVVLVGNGLLVAGPPQHGASVVRLGGSPLHQFGQQGGSAPSVLETVSSSSHVSRASSSRGECALTVLDPTFDSSAPDALAGVARTAFGGSAEAHASDLSSIAFATSALMAASRSINFARMLEVSVPQPGPVRALRVSPDGLAVDVVYVALPGSPMTARSTKPQARLPRAHRVPLTELRTALEGRKRELSGETSPPPTAPPPEQPRRKSLRAARRRSVQIAGAS